MDGGRISYRDEHLRRESRVQPTFDRYILPTLPIPPAHLAIAFQPVFLSQAQPSLLSKYASAVKNRSILGAYLQTELGHGSNVASLETTATYILKDKEFSIDSNGVTGRKWWIGNAGLNATHGVVQARLLLPDGKSGMKDVGPHLFLVQLRSLDDHSLMPGIEAGDIGESNRLPSTTQLTSFS